MSWKRPNIHDRMKVFFSKVDHEGLGYLLDVGTGTGEFAQIMHQLYPDAIVLQTDIRKFTSHHNTLPYYSTIERLPHRLNSLTLIVAAQVLHYLPYSKHKEIINNLYEKLEKGGILIIIEYLSDQMYSWLPYPISIKSLSELDVKPDEIIRDNDKRRPKYAAYFRR